MELKDSVVVVTGAASGLGAGAADWLNGKGARVTGVDINPIPNELGAAGVDGRICDIASEAEVIATLDEVVARHGRLDAVVNCAGIVKTRRLYDESGPFPLDLFRRTLEVNLTGTFLMMAHGAERMARNTPNSDGERGCFVNVASIAAFDKSSSIAYAASKGGVVSMSMTAAHDLARYGIRTMAIAPGYMDTPMFAGLEPGYVEKLKEGIVFPKRLARMEEFGALVGSILTNAYLNATAIRFDAGARV